MANETIDSVFRDFNTPGVPSSGEHQVVKKEVRNLLKGIAGGTAAVGDYRGTWLVGTQYIATDLVQSGGSVWYAKRDNIGVTPVEGADWTLFLPGSTVADGSVTDAKLDGTLTQTLVANAASIASLRAINTSRYADANLTLPGRAGLFSWSANVSASLMGPNIVSSAVNSGTDTITSAGHGLVTGQAVLVSSAVNGLSVNTLYYVTRIDVNNFRLASTFANAKTNTAVDLTGTAATTVRLQNDPLGGIYITPTADLSGASGAWVRQHTSPYNVMWFGALGTGTDDDTASFQAAVFFAESGFPREVFIPSHLRTGYYRITNQILITRPIKITGENIGVTLGGVGLLVTQSIFSVDGTIFPNLEGVYFESMTVRPNISGSLGRGFLFNRSANNNMRDIIIYEPVIGIDITGNRGYGNNFYNVSIYNASNTCIYVSSFTGGGHHNFYSCAFSGGLGFFQSSNSILSGVNFYGCSWEGCNPPIVCEGDIHSWNMFGCYMEKNLPTGGYAVSMIPASGKVQNGFVVSGGVYETDNQAYVFQLGGPGVLRSYDIAGIETEGFSGSLIRANGIAYGGQVRANYLHNMTAVFSGTGQADVTIANNRNASGSVTA